jgi:hypothetical protein
LSNMSRKLVRQAGDNAARLCGLLE